MSSDHTKPTPRQPAARSKRRRHPTFPVTVVRAATIALPELTPQQKERRSLANLIGNDLTPHHTRPNASTAAHMLLPDPDEYLPAELAGQIAEQAAVLLAAPPPGALLIGRTMRGAIAVVVLHADTWSLVAHTGGRSALLIENGEASAFGAFAAGSPYRAIAAAVLAATELAQRP